MRTGSDLLYPFLLIVLISCNTPKHVADFTIQPDADKETITESLFQNGGSSLSEENIKRLLDGKLVLPDTVRISVYKYASNSINKYYASHWYNEEYLKVQQSYFDTLVAQIQELPMIQKVLLMPSIMISNRPTITELRESAVRLQTDLLLVFSVNSDIYYKYKAFTKDEAKAFATCEIIVMDIRTGLIPHSSVITREYLTQKLSTDLSMEETRKRAETGAVIQTLVESGKMLSSFLIETK